MTKQSNSNMITNLPKQVTKLVIRGDMPLLKAWRIHLGIPLAEAAEKSGLDVNVLAEMEHSDNQLTEDLKKIAQALGVDIDLLVDIDPLKDQPDIYC